MAPLLIFWYLPYFGSSLVDLLIFFLQFQKQPSRGVLRKRCYENIQQIYRKTPIPKRDFNKVASADLQNMFYSTLLLTSMELNISRIIFRGLLNYNFFAGFVDGELGIFFPTKRRTTKINTVDILH